MWPSELIGFLYGMACSEEGRKALRSVDETGIPHMGLRSLIFEIKTGNGTESLREKIRVYLKNLGVEFDLTKPTMENVGQHVTKIASKEKRDGIIRGEIRSLASELYEATRNPVAFWSSERVGFLVRSLKDTSEAIVP